MDDIYQEDKPEQSLLSGDFSDETTEDEAGFKYNELLFPSSMKRYMAKNGYDDSFQSAKNWKEL